jgi:hypothetical protein
VEVSPRPLLPAERALVAGLLRHAGIPAREFLIDLDALRVLAQCECGCSSIDFVPKAEPAGEILVDAYGTTPQGQPVGLILWGSEHRIRRLEIYSLGNDPPFAVPSSDTISDTPPTPTQFDES